MTVAVQDPALRDRLQRALGDRALDVESLEATAAETALSEGRADLVLLHRSQVDAALLDRLDAHDPGVLVVAEEDAATERARLLAAGAAQVVHDGDSDTHLADVIETVAHQEAVGGRDGPEVRGASAEPRLADFLSRSPHMREFLDLVNRVVEADTSLLITGATGVGKERLARAIHAESPRRNGPFVAVNCGGLPENLLESELFGHEKGAFTGADARRKGQFELANGGTIFLDEIGEMPPELQVKLLTVLQRHEVQRLGGSGPIAVDVRVMAATNRDLSESVAEGSFREDLYYRLNVVPLVVPALSERHEDIPDLVGNFIAHFRDSLRGTGVEGISDAALAAMQAYPWPGNVRELVNVIERAMLLARGREITVEDLPPEVRQARATAATNGVGAAADRDPARSLAEEFADGPLREGRDAVVARFEHAYLSLLLARTRGRVGETARLAGLAPRSLHSKMKRLGLRKEDFKKR